MKGILDWLDERTGWRRLARAVLLENIPGGARWRHTWLSLLLFAFFTQAATGVVLLAFYSPSSHTAWESVFHLQYQIPGGALLRGLHGVMAQAFVVLAGLHVLQLVLHRAYVAPREIPYWLALVLLPLAIAQSTTGWLLPFDQKGYWAARVPLNILAATPLVGPTLRTLLIGGGEIGSHTLTHFVAFHAVLVPLAIGILLAICFCLSRKQGFAPPPASPRPAEPYWPDQVFKDALACLALLAVVLFVIARPQLTGAREAGLELFAPADTGEPYAAARPEWFMLWLFQFLKMFPGGTEIWGSIVIPTIAFIILAALPWLGRSRLGHAFGVAFCAIVGVAAVVLTLVALAADRNDANYQGALVRAKAAAHRARELAAAPAGIPVGGALGLMQTDSLTRGPALFAQKCASCHRFDGHDGTGNRGGESQSASDLKGFGSRAWLTGLLNPASIATTNYFGATTHRDGKMVKFVTEKIANYPPEKKGDLKAAVAALSAEAQLKAQAATDQSDGALIAAGRKFISETCTDCHPFHKRDEDATAPDLTEYGSRAWLIRFIGDPAHADFYGERNDRMPSFIQKQILSEEQTGLIADWLRGDWYEPEK